MSQSKIIKKSEPSICIPRTFPNITWKRVKEVFEQVLGAKCVERIDMVRHKASDGSEFKRVYVHFKYWPGDSQSQEVRQRLLDGKDIKIVYDEPWFWKCSASRVPRPTQSTRRARSTPYIDSADAQQPINTQQPINNQQPINTQQPINAQQLDDQMQLADA